MTSRRDRFRRYATFPEVFRRAYDGMSLEAAVLGSGSEKDLDLLVVASDGRPVADAVEDFVSRLPVVVDELGYDVIVKHEHRGWITGGRPLLHVMFHPSYAHARSCELPSLLAYAYERGEFIVGSGTELAVDARRYRGRSAVHDCVDALQMHRYAEIAITSLIYSVTKSSAYSGSVIVENLLYVLRFATTEWLVGALPEDTQIQFWDWTELIAYIDGHMPALRWVSDVFRRRERLDLSADELHSLLLVACDLTDRGLAALAVNRANRVSDVCQR